MDFCAFSTCHNYLNIGLWLKVNMEQFNALKPTSQRYPVALKEAIPASPSGPIPSLCSSSFMPHAHISILAVEKFSLGGKEGKHLFQLLMDLHWNQEQELPQS